MTSWYRRWEDAYREARWRAAITRRRYRVRYDSANRWWDVVETTERLG